jgi:putative transposase
VEVSPALISNITGAVMEDVRAWRSRPLSGVYPILYFDALVVKSRQEGPVKNRAVYLALGINLQGEKELLGLWIAQNEAQKPRYAALTGMKGFKLHKAVQFLTKKLPVSGMALSMPPGIIAAT